MIRLEETNKIERKLHNIENTPDDSRRMFQAIKTIKNIKPIKPLLIQSQAGLTANQEEQCKIIAEHFKIQFHKNAENLPPIHPEKMRTPFTKIEITNAIRRLKNNKSPGVDEVVVVHKEIAEIYSEMSATGEYPIEITQGLLGPIQKPGKVIGPPQNLHPIILLSILRKNPCYLSDGKNQRAFRQ